MRNHFYIPGILLIYFFLKFCSPEMSLIKDFLLKIINFINLRAFMYPVFLAGNLISVTAHIDEVIYDCPNGITFTFLTISSFSCNIYICYELNDFLFLFRFSFDVIIIALVFAFVNTFLYIFDNFICIILFILFKSAILL